MAAINFNWNVNKLTSGTVYNYTAFVYSTNQTLNGTLIKTADGIRVTLDGGQCDVQIFREGMTVADVLAIAFKRGAHVESGNAPYKAEILRYCAPVADGYGTHIYKGLGGYHTHTYQARTDCPYYYGIELETVARNESAYNALNNFESNCFYMERDGSLPSYGIEFVSTLIRPQDAVKSEFFEPLCNCLTGLAKSKTIEATGLHVHVSGTAFGANDDEIRETAAKCSDMLDEIIGDDILRAIFGRGVNDWCKRAERSEFSRALAIVKNTAGANILRDENIKKQYIADLTRNYKAGHNSRRYYRLNLTNENTIEFRQGKGNISSATISTIIQFIDTLIKYCKGTKFERLSLDGYIRSIPTSAKYQRLKDYFTSATE